MDNELYSADENGVEQQLVISFLISESVKTIDIRRQMKAQFPESVVYE